MTLPRYFPYEYRPGQEEMSSLIRESVHNGRPLVLESGTGTGKTAVSLSAALEATDGTRYKIIFLTRTKSQQRQVALETRAMTSRTEVLCVSMQGRGPATCPMMQTDHDLVGGTSEEMSKLCAALKKGNSSAGTCPYYTALTSENIELCVAFLRSAHPDPEEFRDFCLSIGVCPYEASKHALQYADIVSAPYAFLFIPGIREHFLQWIGIGIRDAVVIIDEAHNLPSYLRDIQTYRVTSKALDLSMKEADAQQDPEVYNGVSAKDIVLMMQEILSDAQEEYLRRDNDLIPPGYLLEELMTRLGMSSFDVRNLLINLTSLGEEIADAKKKKRKLPRSHILSLARFLTNWISCDDSSHVYLVSGGQNPALEAYCLDPRGAVDPLLECRSSVSISGTLSPLEHYAGDLDLFDPELAVLPSPFPPENLKVGYVRDISTRYTELNDESGTYDRLVEYVVSLVNAVHRNTAVFFPSYALMQRFMDDGVPGRLGRDIYYERPDMPQSELMEQVMDFRCNEGAVLFAVSGGRISEGLDFPGKELELAIIVGVPFSRPSAKQDALVNYYQNRYGKGWDMAVKVPAMRKMRQAIGRLIRSEFDRGMAVILDRRVASLEGISAEPLSDPVKSVKEFFSEQ